MPMSKCKSHYICIFFLLFILNLFNYSVALLGDVCKTPNNVPGKCSYLNDCPSLKEVPPAQSNYLTKSICPGQGRVLHCCPEAAQQNLIPDVSKCGNILPDKILGGGDASKNEYPWMALIEYTKPRGKDFHCGGMLVSSRYVLTAAHCVKNPLMNSKWRLTGVRLGEHDTRVDPDCDEDSGCSSVLNVNVESTKVHEDYDMNSINKFNDIALLRLDTEVKFSKTIYPICLPMINPTMNNEVYTGQDYYVAGWGRTRRPSRTYVLQKLKIGIYEQTRCVNKIKTISKVDVSDKQLCAGGVMNEDSCKGDSGGPLMAVRFNDKRQANFYLVGIISYGPDPCGFQDIPGIYTRVDKYNDWIRNNILP